MSSLRLTRPLTVLVLSNLLGGVGVAAGIAVGGLAAEALGGTAMAGLGQAAGVLGAALAAIPLAGIATAHGRRRALALGYALATAGAVVVIGALALDQLWLLLVGLGLFGVASAANLQSRYAATDGVSAAARGRSMSIVIWATTIGAVAGPNLTAPGDRAGLALGLPSLAGPYLFSVLAFALGAVVVALFFPARRADPARPEDPATAGSGPTAVVGARAALAWAMGHAQARFAVVLIGCAHAVMVLVMVMTPVHMQHHGMTLELVGIVISLHVLGMYAMSPVLGGLVDRWGARTVAWIGIGVLLLAVALGVLAGLGRGDSVLTAVALTVLGLGWSACIIAGSAHLVAVTPDHVTVPLQGVTDAGMNYAGALAAVIAGPVLAWGGFPAINVIGATLLLPAVLFGVVSGVRRSSGLESADNLAA